MATSGVEEEAGGGARELGGRKSEGPTPPQMTDTEAIDLISKNGNLLKRALFISSKILLVGFQTSEWNKISEQEVF